MNPVYSHLIFLNSRSGSWDTMRSIKFKCINSFDSKSRKLNNI